MRLGVLEEFTGFLVLCLVGRIVRREAEVDGSGRGQKIGSNMRESLETTLIRESGLLLKARKTLL